MTDPKTAPQRRSSSGYSAWRLIAEELRAEIGDGRIRAGERLPTENALAERFGVNRHTARQAIASLADEGLVESRRGSGTFVTGEPVHVHRVGVRTRMSSSIGDDPETSPVGRLLDAAVIDAPPEVAERLGIASGPVIRIESTRSAGRTPIAISTRWFDAARVPGIAIALRRTGSVTAALRECGIDDYVRAATVIGARHATAAESDVLGLDPGAVVLVSEALDTLPDGTPLQHMVTRFAAQRVKLDIEHPVPGD